MARIGLKLYFLRTRQREESQQTVANAIGVRQATISSIEQGDSQPSCAILLELCRYYDVTPTYLIDPDRGLDLRATEHWSRRDALATTGMWIESAQDSVHTLDDGSLLCPLLPGRGFYDADAFAVRRRTPASEVGQALAEQADIERAADQRLEAELEAELVRRPRRRRKS